MISIPHSNNHNNVHTRRNNHLQQTSFNSQIYPIDVPRGWGLDLPSDSAIDLLQSQFNDNTNIVAEFLPPDGTMQSEAWGAALPQYQHKMGRVHNHQRESSLSSLGSTGPASPFNPNTSNPQIAVTTDFGSETLDMQSGDPNSTTNNYIVKSLGSFSGYHNVDSGMPEMAYPVTIPGPSHSGIHKHDRGLLPAPELGNSSSRSQPTSVASSVGGDSPATPTIQEPEASEKRRKAAAPYSSVPKLDRTMTDIYSDELYNPNFAITSTTSPSHSQLAMSPANDVFSQRLNAANSQHLSARQSPVMSTGSRERSPFRTSAPLAGSAQDFSTSASATPRGMQFNTAQHVRENNKLQHESQFQQQMAGAGEPDTPKTISPKDAILEFPENDDNRNFPLFATEGHDFVDQFTKAMMPQPVHNLPGPNGPHMNYMGANMAPSGLQVPQQYPFVPQTHTDTPPRLSSGPSSTGSGVSTPVNRARPMGTSADGGTYTCTYHGCTLRFETPALLQKHKREGHRQAQGLGVTRPHDMGMTSSLIGSQAGPHRCNRINPSTGKPCNTVFSRPYDLTRHEDTIHNARKQKVNCDLCTEEKTFSRADALTRHYRVCHPEVEVPGKRRRG
ncbi:hypothetical protein NLU13_3623 [Sarocladium strictum]|uniref:C2H2-type domain-containing protein n=1 Tax=Sarocladium strictum TaxID=5046 RepID=A0AA39LAK9_SARSR|nr:hypothetical protein NLU13_3623 [Sarocladium strictum]